MQQSSALFLVAFFLLAFTVMAASAASSAPGVRCATNSACRRWVCKLNRCGPLSDRGDICDEDADCLPDRDLECFENRCTRCPGETDCSGMDEEPVCANLLTDEDNCGACGNSCDEDEICVKGKCTVPPPCGGADPNLVVKCCFDGGLGPSGPIEPAGPAGPAGPPNTRSVRPTRAEEDCEDLDLDEHPCFYVFVEGCNGACGFFPVQELLNCCESEGIRKRADCSLPISSNEACNILDNGCEPDPCRGFESGDVSDCCNDADNCPDGLDSSDACDILDDGCVSNACLGNDPDDVFLCLVDNTCNGDLDPGFADFLVFDLGCNGPCAGSTLRELGDCCFEENCDGVDNPNPCSDFSNCVGSGSVDV